MNITLEHRQALLRTSNLKNIRIGLIASDKIDWNKNERTFESRKHYANWIKWMAGEYNITPKVFNNCMNDLIANGYYEVYPKGKGLAITRTLPDDLEEPEVEEDDALHIEGLD